MKPKHFLCFLLACCFAVSSTYSQEGTVLVAGLVKDKAGMLIANASVTEKGTQNAVVTNASGLSVFV